MYTNLSYAWRKFVKAEGNTNSFLHQKIMFLIFRFLNTYIDLQLDTFLCFIYIYNIIYIYIYYI